MIKRLLISILVTAAFGCTEPTAPKNTIPVHTGHKQITEALIDELQNNNDWYRSINELRLEVTNPPPSYVINLVNTEMNKIIPKGRSSSVAIDLRADSYEQLSLNNINYHLVTFDNSEWIVWDANDTDAVQDILMSVATKALDAKLSQ